MQSNREEKKTSFATNNFWESTPKRLKRLAWGIKAFCGSSALTLIMADLKWLGIAVAVLGALSDLIIEFFKEEVNNE